MGFLTVALGLGMMALLGGVNYLIIERITRPPRRPWDWRHMR